MPSLYIGNSGFFVRAPDQTANNAKLCDEFANYLSCVKLTDIIKLCGYAPVSVSCHTYSGSSDKINRCKIPGIMESLATGHELLQALRTLAYDAATQPNTI
jgi:hypothetical protein